MMRPWRSLSAKACRACMCFRAVSWCPLLTAPTGRGIGDNESRIHRTWHQGAMKSRSLSLTCRGQSSRMASPEPNHTGLSFWLPDVLPPVPPSRNANLRTSLTRILSSVSFLSLGGPTSRMTHFSCSTSHHVSAIHQDSEYQELQDVHPHHMSMCDYVSRTVGWNGYSTHWLIDVAFITS